MKDNQMTTEQVKGWRQALDNETQVRINAGLRIDPENCEVECNPHGSYFDPYGVLHGLTDDQRADILDFDTIDQNWFARTADSDTWVLFEHLPEATRAALENKWWKRPCKQAGLKIDLQWSQVELTFSSVVQLEILAADHPSGDVYVDTAGFPSAFLDWPPSFSPGNINDSLSRTRGTSISLALRNNGSPPISSDFFARVPEFFSVQEEWYDTGYCSAHSGGESARLSCPAISPSATTSIVGMESNRVTKSSPR